MDKQLDQLLGAALSREAEDLEALALELAMRGYPIDGEDDHAVFEALRIRYNELSLEMMDETRRYLQDGARRIFKKFPHVKSFSWHQYTPYFADGEPCVFEAWTHYARINGEDVYTSGKDTTVSAMAHTEIKILLGPLEDDILLDLFGDHAEVQVTPEGVFKTILEHE